MQPQTSLPDHAFAALLPAIPVASAGDVDMLLALINQCVDAMNLMQESVTGLQNQATEAAEASARDRAEFSATLSDLRSRAERAETSIDQLASRLADSESRTVEMATAQTLELAAARSDAEAWRSRADSDLARLNVLDNRLASLEGRLERRLERTEADLAEASSHVTQLIVRAESGETAASAVEQKLAEANRAMAEQRARIACLHVKLGAATDALRFSDRAQALSDRATAVHDEDDVIDLASLDDRRTTAA